MPKDIQEIVTAANAAVNATVLDEFTARNWSSLTVLVNEHHVQLERHGNLDRHSRI